ncbi:hypothetical protein Y1Q_0008948 [Alligator mississippiensis]|uniref:Uncharacterized protein n=1 Tax=Alligator mississippiensis TaxID=8496 RepID=A0A151NKC8_ALLMI|nr:hypothetical protein Y1Q_0008948 [Alligator mississippiensis]
MVYQDPEKLQGQKTCNLDQFHVGLFGYLPSGASEGGASGRNLAMTLPVPGCCCCKLGLRSFWGEDGEAPSCLGLLLAAGLFLDLLEDFMGIVKQVSETPILISVLDSMARLHFR